jgi:hypothetical protein
METGVGGSPATTIALATFIGFLGFQVRATAAHGKREDSVWSFKGHVQPQWPCVAGVLTVLQALSTVWSAHAAVRRCGALLAGTTTAKARQANAKVFDEMFAT